MPITASRLELIRRSQVMAARGRSGRCELRCSHRSRGRRASSAHNWDNTALIAIHRSIDTMTQRVLTGITTTGTLHLGNYVGAIRPAIAASREAGVESFFF